MRAIESRRDTAISVVGDKSPILVGLNTTKSPTLWDPATGKAARDARWAHRHSHGRRLEHANGKTLVTASAGQDGRRVDVASGARLLRMLGEHGDGRDRPSAIAGDGKIATGSANKKVRVSAATGSKPTQILNEHRGTVTALRWSAQAITLLPPAGPIGQSSSGTADTGKIEQVAQDHPTDVQALAFSADGTRIWRSAVSTIGCAFSRNQHREGTGNTGRSPGSPPERVGGRVVA